MHQFRCVHTHRHTHTRVCVCVCVLPYVQTGRFNHGMATYMNRKQ